MNTSSDTPIEVLTIDELLEKIKDKISFRIPGYQRGYKWTKIQANQLLNDLISYGKQQKLIGDRGNYNEEIKNVSAYYLQPISLCRSFEKNDGSQIIYDVIDGQQRLTTIWLLLYACFKNKLKTDDIDEPSFDIRYETFRDWQKMFKETIKSEEKSKQKQEFSRISLNHFHINEVFSTFDNRIKSSIRSTISKDVKASTIYKILLNNTKIIWSEISRSTDEDTYNKDIKTFTNLNSGKIPLTCGELIKGLILQKSNYQQVPSKTDPMIIEEDQRLLYAIQNLIKDSKEAQIEYDKISREWDVFERDLHDEELWNFIYNKETNFVYETRLEYIFNLIEQVDKGEDKMQAFNKLYDSIRDENTSPIKTIQDFWTKVVNYMATIKDWYRDKEYYHLIGYLVATTPWIEVKPKHDEKSAKKTIISYLINGLYSDSEKWSKDQLRKKIKELIQQSLTTKVDNNKGNIDSYNAIDIDNLHYGQDNEVIRRILLFFNIHTILMQEGEERFPFNRYKDERWDIEHIASQTDFNALRKDLNEAKLWALAVLQYFTGIKEEDFVKQGVIEKKNGSTFEGKKLIDFKENDKKKIEAALDKVFPKVNETSSTEKRETPNDTDKESDNKRELCEKLKDFIVNNQNDKSIIEEIQTLVNNLGFFVNSFGGEKDNSDARNKDENKDKIGNLTLLNMSINRGYGNAIFPVKRITIQNELENGYFVPPCTQRVFQKTYSRRFDQLYVWDESDAEAYTIAIKEALDTFEKIEGTYADYKQEQNNKK